MGYGFRLYLFKFTRGPGKSREEEFSTLGIDAKTHAATHTKRLLEILEGYGTLTGTPRNNIGSDDDYDPIADHVSRSADRGEWGIRFVDSNRTGLKRIDFTVWYGRVGAYQHAMGASPADDTVISDKVASNVFRASMFFPDQGTLGVMAVEVVDRSHPYSPLDKWLTRAAIEARKQDKAKIKDDETDSTLLKAAESAWKPAFEPITDLARIRKALLDGAAAEVEFTQHSRTKGRKKRNVEMRLSVFNSVVANRKGVTGILDRVFTKKDLPVSGAVVELKNLLTKNVGASFDDVAIVVEDGGKNRKIRLADLEKALTYSISGPKRPGPNKWRKAVVKELKRLQTESLTELDLDL